MSNQANIFLLLFGGLQGFLLSVLLIKKRSHQTGYGFLIAYLLVLIVQVLFKVVSKVWLMENLAAYYSISSKLPLLYGPLVYLFTRNILRQRRSPQMRDGLHFIPFVFIAGIIFLTDRYFFSDGIPFLFYGAGGATIQIVSLVVYHYLALAEWQRHFERVKDYFSNIGQLRMQWLRRFIILSFFVCTAISLLIYFMYTYHPLLHFLRWGFVLLSLFIYWISYEALNKPLLFSAQGKDDWQQKTVPVLNLPTKLILHKRPEKYANTGLKEQESGRILTELERLMQQQKIFLDPEITIEKLANMINSNRHFVSQVLNDKAGKSFYDYINQYRVSEAKRLLHDPEYSNQKIASIAYDAGFNSLSAFNDVFKKMAGTTPSKFKKDEQPVSRQRRG
jgi:AraC-like DNA-binding protein